MQVPKTVPEFYQHAMHVIYAVVIGFSFDISRRVVIPIENVQDYTGAVNVGILILGYFIVVTSWIGYFKSISTKSHKEGLAGIARFGTDLFIVYLFYYLINFADPEKLVYRHDVFLWILPTIYGAYLLWDILKYVEYRKEPAKEKRKRKRRTRITLDYLVLFSFMAYIYYLTMVSEAAEPKTVFQLFVRDMTFVAVSIALTFLYRRAKWKVTEKKRPRKSLKAKGINKVTPSESSTSETGV